MNKIPMNCLVAEWDILRQLINVQNFGPREDHSTVTLRRSKHEEKKEKKIKNASYSDRTS